MAKPVALAVHPSARNEPMADPKSLFSAERPVEKN
jgi:hypothetical protein